MTLPNPEESGRRKKAKEPPAGVKRLGLSLPVTEQDVKQAYFKEAQRAHPDHGGAASDFIEVQRAFDEAVEFATRNGKRLPWIGAQMPIYVAQIEAIELVDGWGGSAETETLDWLEDTVGDDFAQLADRLKGIDLSGRPIGDSELSQLLADAAHLPFLESLNLADTQVSDASAMRLSGLASLKRLDLRGTKVGFPLRRTLARRPGMEQVEGTSRVGEWLRR